MDNKIEAGRLRRQKFQNKSKSSQSVRINFEDSSVDQDLENVFAEVKREHSNEYPDLHKLMRSHTQKSSMTDGLIHDTDVIIDEKESKDVTNTKIELSRTN